MSRKAQNAVTFVLRQPSDSALKPRVYPLGPDQPEAAIRLGKRVDFYERKVDPFCRGAMSAFRVGARENRSGTPRLSESVR
jgi:hypothetical protein